MKQKIRLTESSLKKMIKESVRQVINEGHWNSDIYEKWEIAKEIMGASSMLSALYNFLDGDTIEGFIDTLEQEYDLPLGDNRYDDNDEDDEDYNDEDDDY